jgi:aminoglycoside phosphotransferase (APT) family kinase protein
VTAADEVLRRVVPDRRPVELVRPRQGNHKETVVARYDDRPPLVVQLSDDVGDATTEAVLLGEIANRTAVPVPTLLAQGRVGERAYLVTEFVAGADLHERFVDLAPPRRQAAVRRFGVILGTLHATFPFASAGPVSLDSSGALVATDRSVGADFAQYATACLDALPPAFDDLRGALATAVDGVPSTRPPRLFPWDLRPGNALLDDDGLAAVLDWGAPRSADPALSVAKTEHLVTRWYGTDSGPLEAAFRAGYRSVRPLPEVPVAYRIAAVACAAVDSTGAVTRPHYPERSGDDAVAIHRTWLAGWLETDATE